MAAASAKARASAGGDDETAGAEPAVVADKAEDFAAGADVGGDRRQSGRARLEQRQRLRLADAGQRKNVGLAVVFEQVRDAAEEGNDILELALAHEPRHSLA